MLVDGGHAYLRLRRSGGAKFAGQGSRAESASSGTVEVVAGVENEKEKFEGWLQGRRKFGSPTKVHSENIRDGLCHDRYSGHQGVEYDHVNVLVLGARAIADHLAYELVRAFVGAKE